VRQTGGGMDTEVGCHRTGSQICGSVRAPAYRSRRV